VTIPGSVTSISSGAFQGCSSLTAAYFLGKAPTMDTNVFEDSAPDFTIHYARDATGGTSGQTGQNKLGKIILFSIIFLLALLLIFGLRLAIQRRSN